MLRVTHDWAEPAVNILAARTGFTRTEIVDMPLRKLMKTAFYFIPKSE